MALVRSRGFQTRVFGLSVKYSKRMRNRGFSYTAVRKEGVTECNNPYTLPDPLRILLRNVGTKTSECTAVKRDLSSLFSFQTSTFEFKAMKRLFHEPCLILMVEARPSASPGQAGVAYSGGVSFESRSGHTD